MRRTAWNKFKKTRLGAGITKSNVYKKVQQKYYKVRRDSLIMVRLPRIYRKYAKAPLDENKIIFIEHRLPKLSNSFTCLYETLKEYYHYDLHIHLLEEGFAPRKKYVKNCYDLFKDMATAKYVFLCETINVMGTFPKRDGQVITQLWHGCGAFKRFGLSTADYLFGADLKEMKRYHANSNYNYVTVSSPEVIWAYAQALDLEDHKERIVPTGISRTDIFFRKETRKQAFDHLYELFPAARGKKILLFAPTFRGRTHEATTATAFDPEVFYRNFRDEYVLVIKHHPLVRQVPQLPAYMDGIFAYDATKTMSIEDLLCVSDICISDYSSLIFEYSLFERPMIFFAYDLEDYFDWRGFYYPYDELTPGPVFTTNGEMVDYIRHVDERFDVEKVRAFRDKFMSACDGHSTRRILELTMGEEELNRHRKK